MSKQNFALYSVRLASLVITARISLPFPGHVDKVSPAVQDWLWAVKLWAAVKNIWEVSSLLQFCTVFEIQSHVIYTVATYIQWWRWTWKFSPQQWSSVSFPFCLLSLCRKGLLLWRWHCNRRSVSGLRVRCFAIRTLVLKKKAIMVCLCKEVFATASPNLMFL